MKSKIKICIQTISHARSNHPNQVSQALILDLEHKIKDLLDIINLILGHHGAKYRINWMQDFYFNQNNLLKTSYLQILLVQEVLVLILCQLALTIH